MITSEKINGHRLHPETVVPTPVCIAQGDGIGPEIMDATLKIMEEAGAHIAPEFVNIGESVYESGQTSGIDESSWEKIRKTKIFLKAPITTPRGKGYKSLNVTLRKSLGLFANVRPVKSYTPFVQSLHPALDVVIIRENEEDLYAGIEHRQTQDVAQCLKLITRPGCERIIRYAFEYAKAYDRKKVTCMLKDNIMKITDGLFGNIFDEIAKEYPNIESASQIIDIGSARLANNPNDYDVIVTLNLYGDIISDIAAEISGSVGMAGSANIGTECAMFEAIHGSAPDIADLNVANPSGLLQAACMMLVHIGQSEIAVKIMNAWLVTLEQGIHTADIYKEDQSNELVGTAEFADAVIKNLGESPESMDPVAIKNHGPIEIPEYKRPVEKKRMVGVDVFIDWPGNKADELGDKLSQIIGKGNLKLKMITNRGVKVYPGGIPETFLTDHWRCRFISYPIENQGGTTYGSLDQGMVLSLLTQLVYEGHEIIKTENLYEFSDKPGYSLGQGE